MELINSIILLILGIAFEVFFIYLIFWLVIEYLLRLVKNDELYYKLYFYIPILRNVVWVFYISFLLLLLIEYQLIFGFIVSCSIIILKWNYLKSFFYGLFFKLQKGNVVGQYIKLKNNAGMVQSLKNTTIDLELSNGDILQYPYHLLINEPISMPILGKLNKVSLLIDVNTENKVDFKNHVKKQILLNPYVVSPNKLRLDFIEDNNGVEKLKVIVYTCQEIYVSRITDYIRSIKFS